MVAFIRIEDGNPKHDNQSHSWKFYVFILALLLILIPILMSGFIFVLKRNTVGTIVSVSQYSLQFSSNQYDHSEDVDSVSRSFDFLLFTQSYPVTACLAEYSSTSKCSFGPDKEAWSIHGIWPSIIGTIGPEYCKREHFDVNALDSIRIKLDLHWFSFKLNGNEEFWKHEWLKHGSCAEQLQSLDNEMKYFSQGLTWNEQYNINDMLEAASIVPNNSRTYKIEDFITAVQTSIGFKPIVSCALDEKTKKVYMVSEIRLCFDNNANLESCDHLETLNECPSDEILYPEASYINICP